MNNDKVSTKKRTIDLTTFATRKSSKGLVIRTIGVFRLKLTCNSDSYTRGTINISGKTLPILPSRRTISSPQSEINKDSCILLLDADSSFVNFRVGILVDNVTEITKVANDFI